MKSIQDKNPSVVQQKAYIAAVSQVVSKTTMTAKDKATIASFLVFGTLNTVAVTMLLARKSEGRDGTLRYFDHSYILTLLTFMGKAVCMIP